MTTEFSGLDQFKKQFQDLEKENKLLRKKLKNANDLIEKLSDILTIEDAGERINARTQKGKEELDKLVLNVFDNKPLSATDIKEKVNATADQIKKSLTRLIENGKIVSSGKGRGKKYSAVEIKQRE